MGWQPLPSGRRSCVCCGTLGASRRRTAADDDDEAPQGTRVPSAGVAQTRSRSCPTRRLRVGAHRAHPKPEQLSPSAIMWFIVQHRQHGAEMALVLINAGHNKRHRPRQWSTQRLRLGARASRLARTDAAHSDHVTVSRTRNPSGIQTGHPAVSRNSSQGSSETPTLDRLPRAGSLPEPPGSVQCGSGIPPSWARPPSAQVGAMAARSARPVWLAELARRQTRGRHCVSAARIPRGGRGARRITANDWLGRSQYGDPYPNGKLDDVRISCRAYSAAEIATLAH
jgi:hypothetical protein